MADSRLDQVQQLIDQLTPQDQARLMVYLASRLAQVVPTTPPPGTESAEATAAWDRFFQLGEALVATDPSEGATLTATVLAMRR
jgi:hypothetical protein